MKRNFLESYLALSHKEINMNSKILKKTTLQPMNLTAYARSLTYMGTKDVLVLDGIVVSHGNISWSAFCDALREKIPEKSYDSKILLMSA